MDPKGKVAVVTGGAAGIGLAIAQLLAASGARLVIADIDSAAGAAAAREIEANGGEARFVRTDVTRRRDLERMLDYAVRQFGRVDIMINNAGVDDAGQDFFAPGADRWERTLAIDLEAVICGTQLAVQSMRGQGGGVIVNMASIASHIGLPDRFAYSMSKGAVLMMTKAIAVDYVKKNIRCNCISPARVHTPFVDGFLKQHYPGREQEMLAKLSDYQPVGRMGTPGEVAILALYLCSDEASFVTGQAYPIDGGVMAQ